MVERLRRRSRVGIALSANGVWAIPIGRSGDPVPNARPLIKAIDGPTLSELRRVFREVREELTVESVTAYVAILPPLVQARRLELPRLPLTELRGVLTRSAAKYFFAAQAPQVVAVNALASAQRSPIPLFALAAPAQAVRAVFEAAKAERWSIESVVSAFQAWAAAIGVGSESGGHADWMIHVGDHELVGVRREGGSLAAVRRAPAERGAQSVGDWLRSDMPESTGAVTVAVLGPEGKREAIARQLDGALASRVTLLAHVEHADSPELLAGANAARANGPELLPESMHADRRRSARRITLRLGAAAAVLLILAAAIEFWGTRRELHAVEDQRNAIAERVSDAVAQRDLLLALNARLVTLQDLAESAPRWSNTIAYVTDHLPEDAYLLAFRGVADSLLLEGLANRAAAVFEAMQTAPDVLGVRAQAPIRRELRDGERPIERFALAARMTKRSSEDESR